MEIAGVHIIVRLVIFFGRTGSEPRRRRTVRRPKRDHQGLVSVEAAGARTDTAKHVGEAYLMLGFGDKTKEEIVVPLVLHNGNWMLR